MRTEIAITRRSFPILLAAALAAAPTALADFTEEEVFETTATLDSGGRVEIEAKNGSIRVETGAGSEVRVTARKKARADSAARARELLQETEVRVDERGGTVKIDAEVPRSGWMSDESVTVSYELVIPADAELEAKTANGSIEAREIGGRAWLTTNNGSIKARGVGGPLEAESNNGSIHARDVRGSVRAETNNGSIEAEIISPGLDDGVRLKTNNGSVELTLSAGVAASIDARTRNGKVTSDFPGGTQDERKRTLKLELAGGGPRVELESTNGSIRLRER